MAKKELKNRRRVEVGTGIMLLILAFSYIAALLLDFQFISPFASLQEDLSYLGEHTNSLRTSTIAWMATALLTFLSMPFLFSLFRTQQSFLAWSSLVLMSAASTFFFLMAINGFRLYHSTMELVSVGVEGAEVSLELDLLEKFRSEQLFRLMGSSMVGLWAFVMGLSRLRQPRFPLMASIFLVTGAPLLVFFNWYDMNHLLRTIAMVAIIIGVMLFCFRLIYRGLTPPEKS